MRLFAETQSGVRCDGIPAVVVAGAHDEVLAFVERHSLMTRGIGWVDMHLLASAIVSKRTSLWSRNKRLAAAAAEHGIVHSTVRY